MADSFWLDKVRERLARQALQRNYMQRFMEELSDHLDDLKEENMESDATSRMGEPEQVPTNSAPMRQRLPILGSCGACYCANTDGNRRFTFRCVLSGTDSRRRFRRAAGVPAAQIPCRIVGRVFDLGVGRFGRPIPDSTIHRPLAANGHCRHKQGPLLLPPWPW
jgi:hypothetical protein